MSTAFPKSVVTVTGPVSTSGDADTFPTHVANRGWGGLHHADTVAEMYAITTERRMWGMQCTVYNDGTNSGTYILRNTILGGFNDDLSDNSNWIKNVAAVGGNLYVSDVFGIDAPGRGGDDTPYATIQYAIEQAPANKNIIVRKGVYVFQSLERMHYDGTITFEDATVNVSLANSADYLIDNFSTTIAGTVTINLYSGRFLRNSIGYGVRAVNISGVKLFYSTYALDLSGSNAVPTSLTASVTTFTNCSFTALNANTYSLELFATEDMKGSWFFFDNCSFAATKVSFKNDAYNGGSIFKKCAFYGTNTFVGTPYYLKIGASHISYRFLALVDCAFDIRSIDGAMAPMAAILVTQAGTIFSMSRCSFSRYVTADKYAIWKDVNIVVPAYQCVSSVPLGGAGTIDFISSDQFIYIANLPDGTRFN